MSAASDRVAASITALTASVNALIAKVGEPAVDDTAAETTAADELDALNTQVQAALNPPAPSA